MNGTWSKLFSDNTYEIGTDDDILKGTASWSNGRLTDIKRVEISEGSRTCSLEVENTEWHQFDKFIVVVAPVQARPIRTHRVIQAKIEPHHVNFKVDFVRIGPTAMCRLVNPQSLVKVLYPTVISENDVGSWISLVLPARSKPYIEISAYGEIEERV